MENRASEHTTRQWGWWTIGAAAAACLALAGLNLWQQDQSVRMGQSIQAYQAARAAVTLAILDLAIAEDGGQRRSVGADLAHANEALSEVERLLPGIPGGASADGALIGNLRAMRQLVITDAASTAPSGDMHFALEQAYRSLIVSLEERGLIARAEIQSMNRRQTLVANSALLAALLALGATAALLRYLRQLRKRNQRRLSHLTQFRNVVGRINASIVHATDFNALARAVCVIATEINGVVCAAVHMHDPATNCLVRQGVSGPCGGLVGGEPLPVNESESVTVRAFQGARRILMGQSGDAALSVPCPADKACQGIRSIAAIPLMQGQTCAGVMTLFSHGEDFFHTDTADLLDECAAAISFAAQKISAEKSLRDSEARYRTLVEVSPDGILVVCDDQIVMANTVALQLLGAQDADQVIGHDLLEFATPHQQALCRQRMQQVLAD
jgi:PAS domain-containing protein